MPRKKFKCSKCDRSFSMAGHLARHTNAMHTRKGKKTVAKSKRGKGKRKVGRPKGSKSRVRASGAASSMAAVSILAQLKAYQAQLENELKAVRGAISALKGF